MNSVHATGGANRDDKGAVAVPGLAESLCLAATPTFAIMALCTALSTGSMDGICSTGHAMPMSGMGAMYLLMSAFHSPPWLRLIRGWRASRTPVQPGHRGRETNIAKRCLHPDPV